MAGEAGETEGNSIKTIRNPEFKSARFELSAIDSNGKHYKEMNPIRWSTVEAAERDFVRINAGKTPQENVPEFITVNETNQ